MIPVVNAERERSLSSPVGISCLCRKRISTLEFELICTVINQPDLQYVSV